MELEDALTIFSYSSPYPVQLSLLPATTATPPVPRGRRSWSFDRLESRRRQRAGGELPRLRPTRRSLSDVQRLRSDVLYTSEKSATDVQTEPHHCGELKPASDERPGQLSHLSCQLTPAAVHDDPTASPSTDVPDTPRSSVNESDCTRVSSFTDQLIVFQQPTTVTASSMTDDKDSAPTHGIAATSSSAVIDSSTNAVATAGIDDRRHQNDKFDALVVDVETVDEPASVSHVSVKLANNSLTTDDRDPKVFFDVDLHDGDVSANNDSSNIAKPATKKKRSLLGSLRSLLKPSPFKYRRKCRSSSEIVGGAVPYKDPDEDLTPTTMTVTYIVRHQSPDNDDEECSSEIKLNDQQKSTDTSSQSVDSQSGELLSTWIDEVLNASSSTHTQSVDMYDVHQQCNIDQSEVEEPSQAGARTLSDDIQNRQPYTGESELHEIKLDARNFPSAEFEELNSTELQESASAVDSLKEFDVSRSEVVDDELVVGAEHVIITVGEGLQDVGTSDGEQPAVKQLCAASITEVETALASIQPLQTSPSPLLHTDEDSMRTPTVDNDVEVLEDMTTNNSDYVNTGTSDVNDDALTADKNDGVKTTRDNCGLLNAEEEFVAAVGRSAFESYLPAEQETVVAEHRDENTDSFNTVEDVDYADEMSDAESPQQLAGLDSQHHDVLCDDLRDSVVIEVTQPTVSADTSDVDESVPATTATRTQVVKDKKSLDSDLDDVSVNDASKSVVIQVTQPTISADAADISQPVSAMTDTRPQVVKDKRSSECDLDDVSGDDLRHSVVIELNDQTVPTTTSLSSTAPELVKDERSSDDDLIDATKVTTEVPSVMTMLLNLFGVEDDVKPVAKPPDDHATSGHCVVAIETPIISSGGTGLATVYDDVTRSYTGTADTDKEGIRIDSEYKNDNKHEVGGLVLGGRDNSFIDQSPTQVQSLSANNSDRLHVTFSDSRDTARQTAAEKISSDNSFTTSSNKDLSVNESGTKMNAEDDNEEALKTSDAVFTSYRETDLPEKCQFVDRSTEVRVAPIASKSCVIDPALIVIGEDQSTSSGVVDGEGISQSPEKFYDRQTTRPNYDPAQEMGNVKEPSNQIPNNRIVQQSDVVRVPIRRGSQLPIRSPDGPSPTTEQLKRTRPVQRSVSHFTFTVQRPVNVNKVCERSSSTERRSYTGSVGNLSEKPTYTFVVPTVRHRSDQDYNNNSAGTRHFSTPHTRSGGQKFDIKNTTATNPRHTVDSSTHNWWQVPTVHRVLSYGPYPVRTGSVDTYDRKQVSSVEHAVQQPPMNGRLGGSMNELRVSSTTSPGVGNYDLPVQISTDSITIDSPKDNAVFYPMVDQVFGSVPDLNLASPSMNDFCRAESHPDVMTSSRRCDVIDSDDDDDVSGDLTRLRRHDVETARVHDFTRSEPCLDVTASRDSGDVTDDRSRDSTRLRLEPIDAWRLGVQKTSARSAMKDSKRQRVSRLTVQLSSNSGGASASGSGDGDSSPQHVNNKRRPRRRRIVCLSHSSLASSTTNDVTSPTLITD